MRASLVLLALAAAPAGVVHADDASLVAGAAIGAGGQGGAVYSGLDLRLDADWRGARLGLGGRAVWLDGHWRGRDWQRPADAVRVVRLLEVAGELGEAQLALAGGGLAPAQLAHVADGYRATLDDRPRTGARASLATPDLRASLELDDALDPGLIGGALAWQVARPWGVQVAAAVDPQRPAMDGGARGAAIEVSAARRWQRDGAWRIDAGGGVVGEPQLGLAALGFADVALDRGGARWTVRGELRAGSGTVGAAFGPLHRVERGALYDDPRGGLGGALSAGVAAPAGWLQLGVRQRPDLGLLGTLAAGAPLGRAWQAAGWVAASEQHVAGAAAARVVWARRLSSALELARMYDAAAMAPVASWSATAWFTLATE